MRSSFFPVTSQECRSKSEELFPRASAYEVTGKQHHRTIRPQWLLVVESGAKHAPPPVSVEALKTRAAPRESLRFMRTDAACPLRSKNDDSNDGETCAILCHSQ